MTPEAAGTFRNATAAVDVSTNNSTGYTLTMSTEGANNNLNLNGDTSSTHHIGPLTAETTLADFQSPSHTASMDKWGFTTDNNGTDTEAGQIIANHYLPVPVRANARTIKVTDSAANTSITNVTIATKIDREVPAGTYENTVVFSATTNFVPPTTMQDFDASYCASLPTWQSTDDDITLTDTRDNNTYIVRKMADGKCWMSQNLRLAGPLTLTSADSNVTTDFALPASSDTGFNEDDSQTAKVHINSTYGGYYNWYTATAGTGTDSMKSSDAPSSICPKNWRLPTGEVEIDPETGDPSFNNNDFYDLVVAYGWSDYNMDVSTITNVPLSLPFSGYFIGGSEDIQGDHGYWWSSTAYDSYSAHALVVDSLGHVDPGDPGYYYAYKSFGLSVRCVLGS